MMFYGIVDNDLVQPIEADNMDDALLELRLRFGSDVKVVAEEEYEKNYRGKTLRILQVIR